jgi:hypothetical protein
MMITQSGKFQNFEFEILAGNSSNTWQMKSSQIEATVGCTILARSRTVATLLDDATVEPSAPCPDLSREKGRNGGKCAQGPLPDLLLPARCRPPWMRQSRPIALRSRGDTLPAHPRGRRARCDLQTPLGPPHWPPSGRLAPGLPRL